ncbi:small ribosomal subunit protein uS12-like [Convolutriloba macropyga]|uniref:small ribosomal subunit protein uS12-like n=1 Tax=Convolutriloba macropyga TaxID=536237 RepID=UPI003F524609
MFDSIIKRCLQCTRAASSYIPPVHNANGVLSLLSNNFMPFLSPRCYRSSLSQISRKPLLPPRYKKHKKFDALKGNPQLKGIIVKLLVKKPKKPNSANRKCAYVRLSDGRHVYAYIPGIGHSLQEHNVVMIQGGGPQDVPYVYCSIMRGKLDCSLPAHKIKKKK